MNLIQIDKQVTGGLSQTSKMPCASYSLPATACKTGSKLAKIKGSVCHGCYALKGFYNMPNVKRTLAFRLAAIKSKQWTESMTRQIQLTHKQYFRWHDSGDLQSVEHFDKIVRIVRATSHVQHWLPTKEPNIIRQWLKRGGSIPENLTIRISASMIDSAHYTRVPGCLGSGVVTSGATCPAPQQGNTCGECRTCWDKAVDFVTYHKH